MSKHSPSLLRSCTLTWIASAAFYLTLISSYGWREYVAAAATAALATTGAVVFSRSGKVAFHLRFRDLLQAWRIPAYAVTGTWEVLRALGRQLFSSGAPSVLAAVPFDPGDKQNLADAGRRALVLSYSTATPNSIMLGMTDQEEWLLYHQVLPSEVHAMTKNLGARP
ncbi:MAG: hypothetical protein ACTHN5_21680 [Phycisphaerae bacterium]